MRVSTRFLFMGVLALAFTACGSNPDGLRGASHPIHTSGGGSANTAQCTGNDCGSGSGTSADGGQQGQSGEAGEGQEGQGSEGQQGDTAGEGGWGQQGDTAGEAGEGQTGDTAGEADTGNCDHDTASGAPCDGDSGTNP